MDTSDNSEWYWVERKTLQGHWHRLHAIVKHCIREGVDPTPTLRHLEDIERRLKELDERRWGLSH